MDESRIVSFKEKLDRFYTWPSLYVFKFIVPAGKEDQLVHFFPNHKPTKKESKNGKYISITIPMMMPSSAAVVEVYERISVVEGVIAL